MNTTKVQLREPMNFIGVPYRSMGEGLLTEAEMTQRQLHYPNPRQQWGTAHEAGSLEHTAQAADISPGGRVSFQGIFLLLVLDITLPAS